MNNETYEQKCLQLDTELISLMGWQNIKTVLDVHGKTSRLVGDYPSLKLFDIYFPRWTQDDGVAFRLAVEYEINIEWCEDSVIVYSIDNPAQYFKKNKFVDLDDTQAVVRVAIVQAVVNKLKGTV